MDLADDLLVARVDDVKLLLVDALDPLAVNVSGQEGSSVCVYCDVEVYGRDARDLQSCGLLVCARDGRLEFCEQRHIARCEGVCMYAV